MQALLDLETGVPCLRTHGRGSLVCHIDVLASRSTALLVVFLSEEGEVVFVLLFLLSIAYNY